MVLNNPNGYTSSSTQKPVQQLSWVKPLALIAIIAIALLAAAYFDLGQHLKSAQSWIDNLGWWGPVVFIGLYALLTILAVPGSILTLTAGALFGLVWGTIYTFIAAMLGSTGAFLISRYLVRNWIQTRIAANPKFTTIDAVLGREGLKIMILLRLSPVFPFNFLNFALGMTAVTLRDYILAGFAMIPGTLLYVYYGFAAGSVTQISEQGSDKGMEYYIFLAIGLIATIAVTAIITRIAKRSLASATQEVDSEPESNTLGE